MTDEAIAQRLGVQVDVRREALRDAKPYVVGPEHERMVLVEGQHGGRAQRMVGVAGDQPTRVAVDRLGPLAQQAAHAGVDVECGLERSSIDLGDLEGDAVHREMVTGCSLASMVPPELRREPLRVHHVLVGTALVDFDSLHAVASPALRAVLDRACALAQHRLATARAVEVALAAHEAAPFFEQELMPRSSPTAQLCETDLCRALLELQPQLWARFDEIPAARSHELSQHWGSVAIEHDRPLPLQPALARRLTWARATHALREPEHLFEILDTEAAAAVADHHVLYCEGLITLAESTWRLLSRAGPMPGWVMQMPEPYVDIGLLEPLRKAMQASSRASPVVIVRGPAGSGRGALARQALAALRDSATFVGWGFNLDNYHGGQSEVADAPVLLALSHRCVASYGTDDVELATEIARSVLHRPEDARLILRLQPDTFAQLVQRLPELEHAPVLDVPAADLRTRVAALLAHLLVLNDWFRVDWGLPEAIALARQTETLDSLALVLACADQALVRQSSRQSCELACARSNGQLPDEWQFTGPDVSALHVRARAWVADPAWRKITPQRGLRVARDFERERPEDYAQLCEIAASLHLRS